MQYKLSLLALAGTALAQSPSLTDALKNESDLSLLTGFVSGNQALLQSLGSAKNITILAPSNSAFGKIDNATIQTLTTNQEMFTAVLQYHVLQGAYNSSAVTNMSAIIPSMLNNTKYANVTGGQVVKATRRNNNVVFYSGLYANSTVTKADIQFNGGVIHVIDSVLTVPVSAPETLVDAGLSALYGALGATNLAGVVGSTPNLTIFAPSNDAIKAIGSGLGSLNQSQIADILKYHVVPGNPGPIGYSPNLKNGTKLGTVNGQQLSVNIGKNGVFVNNAKVIAADILVANGVVHVIDQVLNPSNTTVANSGATAGVPAFSGASAASDVPYTSGVPKASTTISSGATAAAADPVASNTSKAAAAGPMQTGAVGMTAFLGAAAVFFL